MLFSQQIFYFPNEFKTRHYWWIPLFLSKDKKIKINSTVWTIHQGTASACTGVERNVEGGWGRFSSWSFFCLEAPGLFMVYKGDRLFLSASLPFSATLCWLLGTSAWSRPPCASSRNLQKAFYSATHSAGASWDIWTGSSCRSHMPENHWDPPLEGLRNGHIWYCFQGNNPA